ncbi:MAG: hypothetical protein U0T75_14095 [Chitinophagales bacterium]
MEIDRFLLSSANGEEEGPQYILHTQTPKALIQVVPCATVNGKSGQTYSYQLQNEVEPRYLTFRVVQVYEPVSDYRHILDEAWNWLYNSGALLAA